MWDPITESPSSCATEAPAAASLRASRPSKGVTTGFTLGPVLVVLNCNKRKCYSCRVRYSYRYG